MKRLILAFPLLAGAAFSAETPEKHIQVYAHRGMRSFLPENTLPAYDAALRLGVDWVDMDVILTKDGQVLVSHDMALNPDITRGPDGKFIAENKESLKTLSTEERAAFNRKYAVLGMTLEQTRVFDVGRLNRSSAYSRFFPDQTAIDGTKMPPLREVLEHVSRIAGSGVGFQLEMKTDPAHPEYSPDPAAFAKAVYGAVSAAGALDRTEIQAFDFRCLYELQKLNPKVKTAYLTSRDNERGGEDDFFSPDAAAAGRWTGGKLVKNYGNSIPRMVKELGGFAWEPEDAQLTRQSLDEARGLGLKVVVWSWPEKNGTAFDPAMMARLIDWGVDGIITDDPGRLSSMLAARGLRLHKRCDIP
ncbi:MAG: glycerophosphodiester phosphodiesterase family protein [Elusimicrobiales bacterium]